MKSGYRYAMSVALLLTIASGSSGQNEDIVVQRRSETPLRAVVKALTPVSYGHQVGRWHQPICFEVIGLKPIYAQLIRQQVMDEIAHLDLSVDRNSHCSANLIVAATMDADGAAQDLYKTEPWLLSDPEDGNPPRQRIDALLQPQPVRWFVANRRMPSSGLSAMPSRIRLLSHEETICAYILLDANKLSGATWRQIGDYVAFVSLAGPEPGTAYDNASILSLFSERAVGRRGPPALTAQDNRFLDALYASDASLPAEQERYDIERRMQAGIKP